MHPVVIFQAFAEARIPADFLLTGVVCSPGLTKLMSMEERVCQLPANNKQ